ncbi:MAG TPA: DUF1343 domain-containing protein [archaeon]|nr:DUF1343 domain-containing protein [archaeon]
MHRILYVILLSAVFRAAACQAGAGNTVQTGLDVLREKDFDILQGLKVGLVTNHTGRDSRGVSIIELFSACQELELAAVFTPEHGLEGTGEGKYDSGRLEGRDLPVYSLYGDTRKPKPEWLRGLDVLIFDMQDIGTRFYTYITTMALCMQAAAGAGVLFIVLDRPNPVGGLVVEGPVLEKDLQGNFIAYYPIPVRHGMTVGELALLFNKEFGIGAELEVVPMKSWRRSMYFDQTGLPWVNPSPNMRSLDAAILYPGLGIAEATNLSVGRGTECPFELYGAPYVNGHTLAGELNKKGLEGVLFKDTTFIPVSHKFKNQRCGGVRALVTDRTRLRSLTAGMYLLSTLKRMYPETFDLSNIDLWIGRKEVKEKIAGGEAVEKIIAGWEKELSSFSSLRKKYLLYPP